MIRLIGIDLSNALFLIAIEQGVAPIHLGIIMVVNMEIGMITPPVGLNLSVTSGVAGMQMMKAALPFISGTVFNNADLYLVDIDILTDVLA